MKALALALLPVVAEAAPLTLDCQLQRVCPAGQACDAVALPVVVTFDTAAFAPPLVRGEPPRRAVAVATFGGQTRMVGEPIWLDGGRVTGFWADADMLGSAMLVVGEDGSARLSREPDGTAWRGTCNRSGG